MSVAFRRDGDEEHLEPKFEVPIPPGPNLVTAAGLELIRKRLAQLQAAVPDEGDEAALTARWRDLRYWNARLDSAEVQPAPSGRTVRFGNRVRFQLGGRERVVTIVGHDEADPAHDLIAFTSPLARALLGAEAGDTADFNGKEDAITILAVEVP